MSDIETTGDPKRTFEPPRGRGSGANPGSRFERLHFEPEQPSAENVRTRYLRDDSRSVLSRNDSPDVPFDVSLNPYRGCEHGCSYCYARPTHEYLGLSAGLDFETRILVKQHAPELLRRELGARSWTPRVIAFSGVTDPYQPIERRLGLTRDCLKVLAEHRNPVSVITKNHLVTRDADLLVELARFDAATVTLSVTTLDRELARRMEPRTSTPVRRLEAIAELTRAGVPCGVMIGPVIPGLTDSEIPAILAAAAEAGASHAGYLLLRLPGKVAGLFTDWLQHHYPDRRDRVVHRIRELRDGRLNDSRFHRRFRGRGPYAEPIEQLFSIGLRKAGLSRRPPRLSTGAFRRPGDQLPLLPDGARR